MSFTPNREFLDHLCGLVQHASSGSESSRHALQELEKLYNQQETFSHLAFTLNKLEGAENMSLRLFCGWTLKNTLRRGGPCNPSNSVVQEYAVQSLMDPNSDIRKCASSIVTTIVESAGIKAWSFNLIEQLVSALNSENNDLIDGAMLTLVKIVEDHEDLLDSAELNYPSGTILPALLRHVDVQSQHLARAIEGVCRVMETAAMAMADKGSPTQSIVRERADEILGRVANLVAAGNMHIDVQRTVCVVLILLLRYDTQQLNQMLPNILNFMLELTCHSNLELARDACEIWSALTDVNVGGEILRSMLGRLVPTLLDRMMYSDEELGMIMSEPDDCSVPDSCDQPHRQSEDSDEEDEEGGDTAQWTLRKCAAIALDDLSELFGDELLGLVLAEVDKRMGAGNWRVQEGAILALGCIAEGCTNGMQDHLPNLLPRLIEIGGSENAHILLRSIAFWTTSRYTSFIIQAGHGKAELMLQTLTTHMLSNSKTVQDAAVSAIAQFIEVAEQRDLEPFLSMLTTRMASAYDKFQMKNTRLLFDAVIALCHKMGNTLVPHARALVGPVQAKWQVPDDSTFLPAVFMVIAGLFTAIGSEMGALSQEATLRCYRVLGQNMQARQQCMTEGNCPPDVAFISTSLELLSAVVSTCSGSVRGFYEQTPAFVELLKDCASDPISAEIRQAAFALTGDLYEHFPGYLQRHIPDFVKLAIKSIDPQHSGACSMAAWCLGQMASFQTPGDGLPDLTAFMEECARALAQVLCSTNRPKGMVDNCALSLGRLGGMNPRVLAPHLGLFFRQFCVRVRGVKGSTSEKSSAMIGMMMVVRENFQPAIEHLPFLIDVIVSFGKNTDEQTFMCFKEALQGISQNCSGPWQQAMKAVSSSNPGVFVFLQETYGIQA
eukprot:PhM_4_TR3033/c0_g1_i1/m.93619/K18752/TNPO1, IPO2, KPNB2; transportin-1